MGNEGSGGWLETLGIICRSSVTRVTIMWLHQAPPMTGLTPTHRSAPVQVTSQPRQQRTQGRGWREELHQHFKSPDVSKAAANLHTKQPAQITFNQLMRACCKIIAESVLDSSTVHKPSEFIYHRGHYAGVMSFSLANSWHIPKVYFHPAAVPACGPCGLSLRRRTGSVKDTPAPEPGLVSWPSPVWAAHTWPLTPTHCITSCAAPGHLYKHSVS